MLSSIVLGICLLQTVMVQGMYLKSNAEEEGGQLYTEDGEEIFEGDMVLTQKQIDILFGEKHTRKAIDDVRSLWPNGHVPYRIGISSEGDRNVIQKALQHWMDSTCVQFEEVDQSYMKAHLIFQKVLGCHTQVGRLENYAGQVISIGKGCEMMGVVAHEVGHSLGFYHEHTRPDRVDFVKVIEENIKEVDKKYFRIYSNINSHGVPYDLGSIMHYGLDTFSKNKLNTLVPLDVTKTFVVGQRNALSFLDLKLANKIYNCSDHCVSKPSCENDGFVDKSCKCQCPSGFEGFYCEVELPVEAPLCGGIITDESTITTPNYPNNYPKDITCIWQLKAPKDKHVRVYFDHFDVFYHDTFQHKCAWDVLEVRNLKELFEGERYCGKELDGEKVISEGNEIDLLFKSEHGQSKGFTASITFV